MLNLSTATRIFVALEPVDMRKSFNGLYARVQSVLREEPTSLTKQLAIRSAGFS